MKVCSRQKGAVAVIVVLSMTFFLIVAGLVIDGGQMALTKVRLQNTADATALSCAIANMKTSGACTSATGTSSPIVNNVNNHQFEVVLTVPVPCPGTGQTNCVKSQATTPLQTILMRIAGKTVVNMQAVGTAGTIGGGTGPCVITKTGTLLISGGGSINGVDCAVQSNADISLSGGSTIKALAVNFVSGSTPLGTTPGATRTSAMADPFESMPPPTTPSNICATSTCNRCTSGTKTFQPGNYTAGITIQSGCNATFKPGLYAITGGTLLMQNSSTYASGNGVTFYLTGSANLNIAGGMNLDLRAPSAAQEQATGGINGMLFWQAASDTQNSVISGGSNMTLAGNIYGPQ